MKVVHIGNVANIAYLTVKFLRRKGIEAEVYVHDRGTTCLACPEWEEGDFDVSTVSMQDPDWSQVSMKNGWTRPEWVRTVPSSTWHRLPYANKDSFIDQVEWKLNKSLSYRKYRVINASLKRRGLPELDFNEASRHFDIYRWEQMVADSDIVVAYGAEPISCLVDYPAKPYIAVDYGTPLRTMIFGQSGPYNSQLLRASYEMADWVVLTNPDIIEIVKQLGLQNYSFIPHPIDETVYSPGPSKVRAALEAQWGEDVVIILAPARHDWGVKGNDKMIRAFGQLVKEHKGPIVFILNRWGQEIQQSEALLHSMGIVDKVVWLPLVNKLQMVEYFRAADIVLDQFNIGTFGLLTPEAMACGKPVIVHFNPSVHTWCFPEMPPVIQAQTPEEIYEQMHMLVRDFQLRGQIGTKSREWIIRYHGWEKIAEAHINLYETILSKRAP